MNEKGIAPRILIVSVSGIGNTILFTPTLVEIKRRIPGARVDLLVYKKVFADCVKETGLVDEIFAIPGNAVDIVKLITSLRGRHYDMSITAFPSNRWQFNLFAYLVGARKRITHSYTHGKLRSLSFLQNYRVPADPTLHDVYQNLSLLLPLGIVSSTTKPKQIFHLTPEDISYADTFMRKREITGETYLIGIHAGAGPLGGRKKWSPENFAREIHKMAADRADYYVLLFGGSEEREERKKLLELLNMDHAEIFDGTLRQTASLISRCKFFLSNDTGLMHIAATFNIPQKAVFISTSLTRTRPFNPNAEVLDLTEGLAIYRYPFESTKP